jgi:hypothetical protein
MNNKQLTIRHTFDPKNESWDEYMDQSLTSYLTFLKPPARFIM